MNNAVRGCLPLAGLFLIIFFSIFLLSDQLKSAGFDTVVLHVANMLLLGIGIFSYFIQLRGIRHANPHVFVRSVMAGMMMKMLVCVVATFAYINTKGLSYNKKSVFVAMLLYLVYLTVEVLVVMKMNKKKNA